jgi:hypothetical protein
VKAINGVPIDVEKGSINAIIGPTAPERPDLQPHIEHLQAGVRRGILRGPQGHVDQQKSAFMAPIT